MADLIERAGFAGGISANKAGELRMLAARDVSSSWTSRTRERTERGDGHGQIRPSEPRSEAKGQAEKGGRAPSKHESLAYHGQKYKTAEYVGVIHRTEVGIYETYVMTNRTLTDDEVEADLERLILRMREGPLPPLAQAGGFRR